MKTCLLAAAALLLAPMPLEAVQPVGDASALTVRVRDLDLTQPEGRTALDARLAAAAHEVCRRSGVGSPLEWIGRGRCEREILAQARETAMAAAEARRPSQFAQNAAPR